MLGILLAVHVAISVLVQGEAFVVSSSPGSSTQAIVESSSRPHWQRTQRPTTTTMAAIVGGGRIGCALYVSAYEDKGIIAEVGFVFHCKS